MMGHLPGAVVSLAGWVWGAWILFLLSELCCLFWGGNGTTKSLLGTGLQPSHLKEHALDMAVGTQLLLV